MSRVLGIRLLLTLFALGCLASGARIVLEPSAGGGFPLQLHPVANGLYRIEPQQHIAQPSGLQAGDLLPIRRLKPADRAAILARYSITAGTAITLPILRAGRTLAVTVRAISSPNTTLETIEFAGLQLTMFTIAMLTLWRGRDRTAWALSAVFFGLMFVAGPLQLPIGPHWVVWRHTLKTLVSATVPLAIYAFADALAGASLPSRLRRLARGGYGLWVLAVTAWSQAGYWALVLAGNSVVAVDFERIKPLLSLPYVAPLLVLIAGYRRAAHEDRLRIRWVLWSVGVLMGSAVLLQLLPASWQTAAVQVVFVLQATAILALLYAVLRTRLIDVGFVIDRALVFGVITALVFGTFSVLELGVHQFAVSDRVGWALQAFAALILAVVLSPLHRRLESWIEQIFFRSQRLALLALERLAHECPFVERETHLLAMTVERLQPHCAAVAIYERSASTYRRSAAHGGPWPEALDADDPAFVALRATHEAVPLAGRTSGLGPEGLALPMTAAQSVIGTLVCRPRDGEQFAPEIRAALANVAHHLGMAVIGLRHREHARLVADVAAGHIDAEAARRRAITLLEGELPQLGAAP